MEKGFAEVENRVSDAYQRPQPGPASGPAPIAGRKGKVRGEHCLNVYASYEFKCKLAALAEKHHLSLADILRLVIKAGIPVFESLAASQEELISGFVQLLRKSRSMGELKK